jgi:hypothetical protein
MILDLEANGRGGTWSQATDVKVDDLGMTAVLVTLDPG